MGGPRDPDGVVDLVPDGVVDRLLKAIIELGRFILEPVSMSGCEAEEAMPFGTTPILRF